MLYNCSNSITRFKYMNELTKKIDEAMKCRFVGDVIFTDDELAKMYAYANSLLRSYDYGYTSSLLPLEDNLLFVAMVNATKSWRADEDRFWTCIAKVLLGTEDCSQKVYDYLTKLIARLGKRKAILYLDGCTKKYYATILAHAFAPIKSIESFCELCWQIFCEDLDQNYNEHDDIYNLIAKELANRFCSLGGVEDDFELGSQVYSLRAGIKRLAVDATDKMAEFIQQTILLISKVSNSEPIDGGSYFSKLIRQWWNVKEPTLGVVTTRIPKERAVTDYSSIKPKYIMDDGVVNLLIPSIRLKDKIEYNPYLEIYRGKDCIFSNDLLTKGSGLSMATKPYSLDIERIISDGDIDIRVVISHCGTPIYDSKKTLERTFILFKDGREIFAQECLPGNYNLFTFDLDCLLQYPDNIKKQDSNKFVFNALEGEAIQSKRRIILFASEKQNRDVWACADKKNNVIFRYNGEDYQVLDGELKIATIKTSNLADYGVRYEDFTWRLMDFSCEEKGDINYYNISELLSVCEPQKITVFKYSTNKIVCNVNMVKFNNIQISFDKDFYYDNQSLGEVRFLTEKFDVKTTFDINNQDIYLPIQNGEIVLKVPLIKWRIDDLGWNNCYLQKGIWYKNITNSSEIEFDIPSKLLYQVALSTNEYLEKSGINYHKYKLGQTVYSIKDNVREILVFVKINEKELLPILRIHTEEKFLNDPILMIAQRQMLWIAKDNYIGDETDFFKMTLSQKGKEIEVYNLKPENSQLDISNIEDGFYDVKVELLGKSFLQKSKILWEKQVCIGNENALRFNNKIMVLDKVMLDNQSTLTTIKTIYIENIKFLQERDGCLFYSGSMYFIHPNGKKTYLNSMKNDYGTFDKTNPVRIELQTKKTCWIVAGLESDDIDDFLGELFLDQYNQISNVGKGTKAIHYYAFSTKEK